MRDSGAGGAVHCGVSIPSSVALSRELFNPLLGTHTVLTTRLRLPLLRWCTTVGAYSTVLCCSIFGEPGSGKSTLLAAIAGCDVGPEKVDGSTVDAGAPADAGARASAGSGLGKKFSEYVARRLVVQEVAWHGGSGSAGPAQRYDVSVCVVEASTAAATSTDGAGAFPTGTP